MGTGQALVAVTDVIPPAFAGLIWVGGLYRGMDWRAVVAVAVFGAMVAVTSFTRRMEPDKIAPRSHY